ncbi:MAG: PBP1A family penicillin-binding protein, partial [Clostridia bacterium]|nr:PBP1A family penicillin-binding protein [Clostridia bacterium]
MRARHPWLTGFIVAFSLAFVALVLAVLLTPLPRAQVPQATQILDAEGRLAAKLFVENRTPVPLAEVPVALREAVVAVEDDRFYRHFGIDPIALVRALVINLRAGHIVEGGSTITQQLAKNLYLTRERSLGRKVYEAFLTLQLEARYSKDEILEMYLNQIYLGHGTYGVEAASRLYFGKPVRELDLAEAALLAGLPRAPETYSPFRNPDLALQRRRHVLNRMAELGYLKREQADAAAAEPLRLAQRPPRQRAAYFVDYVLRQIEARHPEMTDSLYVGGYRIYTTMDLRMQEAAERALAEGLPPGRPDRRGVPQPEGALVAIDPRNGYIKALVGGRDPDHPRDNRAVEARRQPGSAFKPFLYAAVLSRGYTVVDRQVCEFVRFPGRQPGEWYTPADYTEGGRRPPYHNRPMSVREAVEISDNVVAVRWTDQIGPRAVIDTARAMGIQSRLEPTLDIALGSYEVTPLEMAVAYAPLANLGWAVEPVAILRIVGPDGQVVEEQRPRTRKVLDEGVAYILTDVLKGVLTRGTARNLGPLLDRPAAGKTGTTEFSDNAWFVGYTPDLVAAVYVGNDRPSPLPGAGASLAGPVWARFMREALAGRPATDWSRPANVLSVRVSADDGLLPNFTSPTVEELFLAGTEPRTVSPIFHWDYFGVPVPVPGGPVSPEANPA